MSKKWYQLKNIKVDKVVVTIFVVSVVIVFLPTTYTAIFLNFVNIFIPISVFAMFLRNNVKTEDDTMKATVA